jgi:hypothetical protein
MATTEALTALVGRWQARALALRDWSPAAAHELDLVAAELDAVLAGRTAEHGKP